MSQVPQRRDASEYRMKLSGIVDSQIHLSPDIVKRTDTEVTFADQASEAGYFGWISKCHQLTTAGRQALLKEGHGRARFFGSVALNNAMGGLNPYAVEEALKLGASVVWMPTLDAANHIRAFGKPTLPAFQHLERSKDAPALPTTPLTVLETDGSLNGGARAAIDAMRGSGAILATGHLSLEESLGVIEYAKSRGVSKIVVTHPEFKATFFSKEEQRRLAEASAILEHCATGGYDPRLISENIRYVGASHCILSSDSGQHQKGNPIDVMYELVSSLENEGISVEEIQRMTIDNPRKLLGV